MRCALITTVLCGFVALGSITAFGQDADIKLVEGDGKVSVLIGDELFTEYIYQGYEKPILYPIIGPTGTRMTRDYPMREGTPNEAKDHPHHKSIWFGHMLVNGESFWHVGATAGTTEQTKIEIDGNTLRTTNKLIGRDGVLVATDSREISFSVSEGTRFIDYSVTYHASEVPLTFGDNKDGQMGIRMHPNLRIKAANGKRGGGQAINARGDRESSIWGKRAEWIDYWGQIEGQTLGIAVFDHPSNLRHPTWWHARDYGLLSANPFGIHHFESRPDKHLGDYTLPKDWSLTFKHRFVFHAGDYQEAKIAQLYQAWIEN